MAEDDSLEAHPPYRWATLAAGAVFLLYVITLAPTTAFWDTSEYIATSHILGIPHPPGNPLFVLLGRTWELLLAPLGLSVAVRINLFSAFMSAAAHGFWFLVVHHILGFFTEDRRVPLGGAAVAILVSATAFTVWNQSNVNEKVYTVSLFTIALLSWLAFHWRENLGKGRDDNLLVLMAFILALSVGNHLMAFLVAPAALIFVLMVEPRTLWNWRLYAAGAVAVFLGLSVHMFLPLRATLGPVINEGAPICESVGQALTSIVTWGQSGCTELSAALSRSQYDKPPLLPRQASPLSQLSNFLQYFDWQWARGLMGEIRTAAAARLPFTILFTSLGILGLAEHAKRDRVSAIYMGTLFLTLSFGLLIYMNFEYGYSLASPTGDRLLHEVRERDYFFIVGFSVWGLFAGMGLTVLWRRLSKRLDGSLRKASPILAIAALPLLFNWSWASRRGDWAARDWAHNLLMSVEPYGVLFTNGDNDTFPLWYIQEVEGVRQDVTVIVSSYLNTPWYAKQLRDLTRPCPADATADQFPTRIICQRGYDEAAATGVYTANPEAVEAAGKISIPMATAMAAPTASIINLDEATIDGVASPAGYFAVAEDRSVGLGPVTATLRGGSVVEPWHQFALSIISNSLNVRPIYFASLSTAANEFGIGQYLVREGLAFRLNPGLPTESETMTQVDSAQLVAITGLWVNAPRTERLSESVFVQHGDIPDGWAFWPDQPSVGIPNYYAWMYAGLAQVASQAGDATAVGAYSERIARWQELGR